MLTIKPGIQQGESDPEEWADGNRMTVSVLITFALDTNCKLGWKRICLVHKRKRRQTEPLKPGKGREVRLHFNLLPDEAKQACV